MYHYLVQQTTTPATPKANHHIVFNLYTFRGEALMMLRLQLATCQHINWKLFFSFHKNILYFTFLFFFSEDVTPRLHVSKQKTYRPAN